jgi:heme-degrading monooxygenase HmoA
MTGLQAVTARAVLRLSQRDDPFVVMSLIDVAPDEHAGAIETLAQGHEGSVRAVPGFAGGVTLTNEGRERIVTITCWQAQADYLGALLNEEASAYARQIAGRASRVRTCTYRLIGARSAVSKNSAEIFVDPDHHCCVIWGVATDGPKRDMIINYNLWETDRLVASLPGFRFATFMTGHDPRDFAELTQWEDTEQFKAAYADPGFQEHIPVNNHYCSKDVSFHRAVAVAAR